MTPYELQMARLGAQASGGLSNLAGYGQMGTGLGGLGTGIGAYQDFASGTTLGDIAGTANLAKLGALNFGTKAAPSTALGSMGASSGTVADIGKGATGALDALQVYEGIRQGGVTGYGSALGAGIQGAGLLMNNPMLQGVGGAILAPIDTYEAIKNWQSGNTGSDALAGAEAGAAWGSLVGPEGALIGAVIGGAVGAISSAFGGGRADPETGMFNQYAQQYNKLTPEQQAGMVNMGALSPQQAFTGLAGVMDAKNNTPGHSESIEQVYGRMGEGSALNAITGEINRAVQSGQINPNESIQDQWSKTIAPWLKTQGVTFDPNARTSKGTLETAPMIGDIQSLMGAYEQGNLTNQTVLGMKGQKDPNLQGFVGWGGTQQAQPATTNAATAAFYHNDPNMAWKWNAAPPPTTGYTGQPGPSTGAPTLASMSYNPTPQPAMMQAPSFGLHARGGRINARHRFARHLHRPVFQAA